jgi:hypothetical protein
MLNVAFAQPSVSFRKSIRFAEPNVSPEFGEAAVPPILVQAAPAEPVTNTCPCRLTAKTLLFSVIVMQAKAPTSLEGTTLQLFPPSFVSLISPAGQGPMLFVPSRGSTIKEAWFGPETDNERSCGRNFGSILSTELLKQLTRVIVGSTTQASNKN